MLKKLLVKIDRWYTRKIDKLHLWKQVERSQLDKGWSVNITPKGNFIRFDMGLRSEYYVLPWKADVNQMTKRLYRITRIWQTDDYIIRPTRRKRHG